MSTARKGRGPTIDPTKRGAWRGVAGRRGAGSDASAGAPAPHTRGKQAGAALRAPSHARGVRTPCGLAGSSRLAAHYVQAERPGSAGSGLDLMPSGTFSPDSALPAFVAFALRLPSVRQQGKGECRGHHPFVS